MSQTTLASALVVLALLATDASLAGGPPGPAVINGRKVLTLVSRDPPALRCNNNIQVAAELSNVYKVPVVVVPVTFAGPGAKAPAVYWGEQTIAVDGGEQNGMIDFIRMSDVMEIEDVPKQDKPGRLLEVRKEYDALRQAIRTLP